MYDKFYRALYRIRRVEEEIARIYPTDKIKSPVHLSIGQEAAAVGVCQALRDDDIVFGTYRSHASYLAKGGDLKKMIAELYGKVTGSAKGKGGSMHLIDVEHGVMGTSAVVGTTIPQAVGYAYALRLQRKDTIVTSFFGDGALEEGVFHESLNFAALKKIPILFVCENNGYAIHSRLLDRQPNENIIERVRTYGIQADRVIDGDVLKLYELTKHAVAELRSGHSGPWFIECKIYRWKEHVGPNEDFHVGYRPRSEAEPWIENDQVVRLAAMVDPHQREQIEAEVEAEIEEAFEFAEKSPFPEPHELYTDLGGV
ncbi:MAG: thiamine pyrophosphate-dependent dehydrogenase E1 component subunit alpha [Candidatus Tectomicrobia bacterium]|nr:thiamine pyrophosphate-dependent dehydrogenase E1 component subunit alpha [Candidatus Tectomicrobia bacterium]